MYSVVIGTSGVRIIHLLPIDFWRYTSDTYACVVFTSIYTYIIPSTPTCIHIYTLHTSKDNDVDGIRTGRSAPRVRREGGLYKNCCSVPPRKVSRGVRIPRPVTYCVVPATNIDIYILYFINIYMYVCVCVKMLSPQTRRGIVRARKSVKNIRAVVACTRRRN